MIDEFKELDVMKTIHWKVRCLECETNQASHSHKKRSELSCKRRKECDRCGRSFLAKEGRKRYKRWKKSNQEEKKKKSNFHKYSRSS